MSLGHMSDFGRSQGDDPILRTSSFLENVTAGRTKVAVIWTGGTMGSNQEMRGDKIVSKPGFTGPMFGSRFLPENMRRSYDFKWLSAIPEKPKGIDSTEMTTDMMERVVEKIRDVLLDPAYQNHRIVVTHGTDSLAHSAAYASFALQHLDRPVVFTGAQIAPTVMQSDAVHNFSLAVQAAGMKTGQCWPRSDPASCAGWRWRRRRGSNRG